MANESKPEVAVVMGSASDWETMKRACDILDQFGVAYHKQVISAHRTPELMAEFAHNARANGLKVIIAGAGGAAHLPGMIAAQTTLPVIGVPVRSHALSGWDSLLSIVQMPAAFRWPPPPSATPVPPTPACSPCRCSPPSSPNWPTSLRITVTK